MARLMLFALTVTAALGGASMLAHGAWIRAKAVTAQYLIERAWQRNDASIRDPAPEGSSDAEYTAQPLRPWPWADTQVLARLRVPSLAIEQYVLAGAHGQALAFGPGHLSGTPLPGEFGNAVVAGHRDTHFRFVQQLEIGDEIWFDLPQGRTVRYRVRELWVTTDTDPRPLVQRSATALTLITCYPFDALSAGGALRYIVEAEA